LTVSELSIEAVNVSNAGLQHLKKLKGLRWLRLWSPGFTDDALEHLAALNDLETLDLEGTAVEGTTLEVLKPLQNLEMLVLGPKILDSEIARLKHLPALRQLDLRACARLTSDCLESLGSLSRLEIIWLPQQIRSKGRKALRESLPDCQVRS
jgi:hypothetical protein